jgi:hypothetical protein
MRNLTLTIHFCDISQFFVSATKYENTCMSSFSQKAGLQDFIKKCITPEPLEINKRFIKNWIPIGLADVLRH